ncbi:hypothetical protein GNI_094960 [Gregarina niphandrodes]|uniref:Uncharacterized protein n=1 Tax=Gregarina niphandrodes TaxID=110365 RepID=A0A023B569_GRENI|nr:hypothetical protein GNI_094960 [Gregarina niphandrodes]EZG58342.1 hypothetical protein GNI_094960 [Gregarina niphandrodes]|eukprot:XP_011130975.1 hypothetical protein GNI_094960 [Gregarina niphandrodes]
MTSHAEGIILDCLKAVRPLLLGQRPVAAVNYVAGKPLRATDVLNNYRQQFHSKLLMYAERLRLAKELLVTAMVTLQATEYLQKKVPGEHPLCLVSLLGAHRKLVELQHCCGTLSFFKGKMYVTQSLQPKPEFQPDYVNSVGKEQNRTNNDYAPHLWHRLPGHYQLSILRRQGDRHELRIELRSGRSRYPPASTGGTLTSAVGNTAAGKSCPQWLHETRKTISLDITASKYISWSFEHDSLEDLLLAGGGTCDCCSSADKWHEVEETTGDGLLPYNSAAPDSFERVEIDVAPPPKETSRRARKRSRKPPKLGPAAPPRPPPPLPVAAVEQKIQAIELPALLFEGGGLPHAALPDPAGEDADAGEGARRDGAAPVAIFVISSGKKEDVLRFMYLARLIYAHTCAHAREVGGSVSHESLLRLLTL